MDDFKSWFKLNGGSLDHDSIDFIEFPASEGGRGAVALRDIPPGHTLASIPRTLSLSTRNSLLPSHFGVEQWHLHKLHQGWSGLILCMMWESAQGPASKWSQYLASLPTHFDTPMFWNESDLKELPFSVLNKLGKDDAEKKYHVVLLPAIQSRPDLFPPTSISDYYSLEQFHLMGSRILSRSFQVERWQDDIAGDPDEPEENEDEDEGEEISMVPVADLLNARFECENSKLFYEKDDLKIVSTKAIKAGDQIWNTYGDLPNAELLRRYGHLDLLPLPDGTLGNPGDEVEIRADLVLMTICSRTNVTPELLKYRIEWWLDEGEDDVLVVDWSLEIPPALISMVRLLTYSAAEWGKAHDSGKLPKPKSDSNVLETIRHVLTARLSEYTTEIEVDENLLCQELSPNKRNAVIVRLGEKKILRGCLRQVEHMLESWSFATNKRKQSGDTTTSSSKKMKR